MIFLFSTSAIYTDYNSVVTQNQAQYYVTLAPYFEIILGSVASLYGTTITDNYAKQQVGAIKVSDIFSALYVQNATFARNSAGDDDTSQIGVIWVLNQA